MNPDWLIPDWPAPPNVRAFVTTRAGGVSEGAYASMNLGMRSGDDPANVARNRLIVGEHLPRAPGWLAQCHGVDVLDLDRESAADRTADAAVTTKAGRVCGVLTADCLPVLLCNATGTRVGIAHAGWRGMAAGVIENTVGALRADRGDVIAWLGPAIGPDAFEVGPEVRGHSWPSTRRQVPPFARIAKASTWPISMPSGASGLRAPASRGSSARASAR